MKTLEERKAEALELLKNCEYPEHWDGNFDKSALEEWAVEYSKEITELLQPVQTDDEVDEAYKVVDDEIYPEFGGTPLGTRMQKSLDLLKKAATQPKSCDGLILDLKEEIEFLRNYGNKDCTHMADKALAEHRNKEKK